MLYSALVALTRQFLGKFPGTPCEENNKSKKASQHREKEDQHDRNGTVGGEQRLSLGTTHAHRTSENVFENESIHSCGLLSDYVTNFLKETNSVNKKTKTAD
jgi:hypothetical protein